MLTETQPRRIFAWASYEMGEDVQEGSTQGRVMAIDGNLLHVLHTTNGRFTVFTYDLHKPTLPSLGRMDATRIATEEITSDKPELLEYCRYFTQQHGGQQ